jgi:hypothetical protein
MFIEYQQATFFTEEMQLQFLLFAITLISCLQITLRLNSHPILKLRLKVLDLLWVSRDAVLVNFPTAHMESKGTQTGMELLTLF